jgi:2-oxoglutarate dehydrogenase E2 component (dihydrolipoamide succinyltransferase)
LLSFGAQLTRFPFQIDVAVNAPEAGTIKEFLANEEDTVTVGQDLVRLELGGEGGGETKEKAEASPKEAASKNQPTSSDPEPKKDTPEPKKETPEPKKEESSPPPQKSEPKKPSPPKQESKKDDSKSSPAPTLGNREERRVSRTSHCVSHISNSY